MNSKKVLLILIVTNVLTAMGITNVVPLIGNLNEIFNVSQAFGIWIITIFMLSYTVGMVIVGGISDAVGRKPVYITSMALFTFGLLLSGLTQNFSLVLVGRFLQGVGASGVLPVSQSIAYEFFGEKKGLAMGGISAAFGIGAVLAINLAGAIYSVMGWQAIFLVIFGLSSVGLGLTLFLPETIKTKKKLHIDTFGVTSFGLAVVSFMLVFKNLSGDSSVLSPAVMPFIVLASIAGIFFWFNEKRCKNPAVDPNFFKKPAFSSTVMVALLAGIGMFLFQTMLPNFAQILLGYSVSTASYSINAMAATMIIFSAISGQGSDVVGPEKLLFLSVVTTGSAFYLLANFASGEVSYYLITALAGVGLGSLITPINYIAMREAGSGNEGVASGIASLSRTAGGIVGPTVAGYILSQADYSGLFAVENILNAYSNLFTFGFWVLVIAFVATVFIVAHSRILSPSS